MAFRVADRCMQIHGGIGLTTDLPIEKFWRRQRSYRITEGATEVMKMAIARHVLKTSLKQRKREQHRCLQGGRHGTARHTRPS